MGANGDTLTVNMATIRLDKDTSIKLQNNDADAFLISDVAGAELVKVSTIDTGESLTLSNLPTVDLSNNAVAVKVKNNEAAALDIKVGTNSLLKLDTANDKTIFGTSKLDTSSQATEITIIDDESESLKIGTSSHSVVLNTIDGSEVVDINFDSVFVGDDGASH